jgi:hypothetical protein
MADHNEERIEQTLRKLLAEGRVLLDRGACPDEERLAVYLSGNLSDADRDTVEEHLSRCSFCLSEIAAVNQALQNTHEETVPRLLMERAMRLVASAPRGNVVQLVVRLAKDAVELVSGAGEWIIPVTSQFVAVRGATPHAAGIVQVEKEIDGYKVEVDVEQVETGICQVALTLSSIDGKAADGMRVSLLVGEREQASFLTRQGRAIFAGVPKGDYKLVISRAGTVVGTINLAIEA